MWYTNVYVKLSATLYNIDLVKIVDRFLPNNSITDTFMFDINVILNHNIQPSKSNV